MPHLDPAAGPAGRALARAAAREFARLRRIGGPGRRTARRIERARLALALGLLAAGLPSAAGARTPIFVNPLLPFGLPDVGGHAQADFADLDGDGDLDALVGETAGNLLYFPNTGTRESPAFGTPVTNPFGLVDVGDFSAPAFADIDTDGDFDAFVGGALGETTFFFNTGSTIVPAFQVISGAAQGIANVMFDAAPAVADLDGDGDVDLFIGDGYGNVVFLENVGSPTSLVFGPPVTNPFGLSDVGFEAAPRFVDLDGDGDLDALVGNEPGDFLYFANTGTAQQPAFAGAASNPFGLADVGSLASPAAADIDGDGDADLLVGTFAGNVVLFSNVGSGRAPVFFGPVSLADVGYYSSPTFGDLDGDGDLDALVGEAATGQQFFFRNEGTQAGPRFGTPSTGVFGLTTVGGFPAPELVDFDADGDLDALVGRLVSGADPDEPVLFRNTGSATVPAFAPLLENPLAFTGFLRTAPALADLDGDGDLDGFLGGVSGGTVFIPNTGTATEPAFVTSGLNPFGMPHPGDATSPSFADVDGDGDLDFLAGDSLGSLTFARNDGTATAAAFGAPQVNPFGLADVGSGSAPAFADIDADGDADLFVGTNSGVITFFSNLTPLCPEAPEPGCAGFAAGALSVDERREGNEKLTLKLAKGPALAQSAFGDPTVAGSQALSACIYDGNGKRTAALEVRRSGASCGSKPCWKPIGKRPPDGKGFIYKDPAGEADGVRSLKLAGGGEGRSSLAVAASNRAKQDERALPVGIALALAASPQVTVQVHGPGACFEAVLDDVTKQEADRFKAR